MIILEAWIGGAVSSETADPVGGYAWSFYLLDWFRKMKIKRVVLLAMACCFIWSAAFAVPDLQLFVAGGTYDWGTQTWVTSASTFDLYVISANDAKNQVFVSLALAPNDDPSFVTVTFDGNVITPGPTPGGDWGFGYAPIMEWTPPDNVPPHGIFPTWYTEQLTGAYGLGEMVGDTQPPPEGDGWDPVNHTGPANAPGEVKVFSVEVGGQFSYIHFDAYTTVGNVQGGELDKFAPFSHDATVVPEPGTLALFATGIAGLGLTAFRRKFRK